MQEGTDDVTNTLRPHRSFTTNLVYLIQSDNIKVLL